MPVYNEPDRKKWTKDKRHWFFRCSYEDINGNKKRYKSKMYFSQDEAKDAESEFLIKVRNHDNIKKDVLFKDVFNEWLFYKKRNVKTSTIYEIEKIAKKHILCDFENSYINISESSLNLWLEKIEASNYSIKHKNKIIGMFREMLIYAKTYYKVNDKLIAKLQSIKDERPILEKKIDNFWTFDEFKLFINVVDNEYDKLLFCFLYLTGCRIGEVMALNWHDIDFNKKTLKINKTLNLKVGNGSYIITSPKTKNSLREIDLSDNLVVKLRKHYENEKKIINFNENMFVFGNINHLSTTTLWRKLKHYTNTVKQSNKNFKNITIHGFRHSHVSLLVHLGCDFRDIAERLGDTLTMVQNTYYHMYPDKKSKTVMLLNKLKI